MERKLTNTNKPRSARCITSRTSSCCICGLPLTKPRNYTIIATKTNIESNVSTLCIAYQLLETTYSSTIPICSKSPCMQVSTI